MSASCCCCSPCYDTVGLLCDAIHEQTRLPPPPTVKRLTLYETEPRPKHQQQQQQQQQQPELMSELSQEQLFFELCDAISKSCRDCVRRFVKLFSLNDNHITTTTIFIVTTSLLRSVASDQDVGDVRRSVDIMMCLIPLLILQRKLCFIFQFTGAVFSPTFNA